MRQLTMGRVGLALSLIVGVVSLAFGDYDHAESNMRKFYAQMASTDFRQARQNIDEAIRLWPSNARYYGWRGYATSQELASQCDLATGFRHRCDYRRFARLSSHH
jgi:hypothetical protein